MNTLMEVEAPSSSTSRSGPSPARSVILVTEELTHATLLQTFERLRRDLCHALFGNPGMFAGFDRLHLPAVRDVAPGPLHAQVSVLETFDSSVRIEYVAFTTVGHRSRVDVAILLVAVGSGRTMSLTRGTGCGR